MARAKRELADKLFILHPVLRDALLKTRLVELVTT